MISNEINIRTPNKDNIQLGDLLVVGGIPYPEILPVIELGEDKIIAQGGHLRGLAASEYDHAVVLKADGTYLVGRNVRGFFTFIEKRASEHLA